MAVGAPYRGIVVVVVVVMMMMMIVVMVIVVVGARMYFKLSTGCGCM
jgi:hypothetical protein